MKNHLAVACVALAVAGCGSTQVKEEVKKDFSDAKSTIDDARAKYLPDEKTQAPIILRTSSSPYLGKKSVTANSAKSELPRVLRSKTPVHFSSGAMLTVEAFGRLIAEETALPVHVDAPEPQAARGAPTAIPKLVNLSVLPPMPWTDLLNTTTSMLGVDWDWQDNALYLQPSFLRTYRISNTSSKSAGTMKLGKTSQSAAGASAGGNSGSSGNFSSQLDGTIDSESDPWKEAEASIKGIAGDKNVIVNRTLGAITVNCSKACHKLVKDFVDEANHHMTQQVLLHVVEMSVAASSAGQSGVDWALVYRNVGKGFAVSFNSPTTVVNSANGNVGVNILNPTGSSISGFDGSAALFRALSDASKIVEYKPFELIAVNNEPTTLANTDQQTYVAQTTVVPIGTSGTPLFTSQPGYVTYGQLIQVIPTVLAGGKIMIRFGIDDTKLKELVTATRQGDIDKVLLGGLNFTTKAILQAGSTLILSGFKRKVSTLRERGILKNQTLGSESGDVDTTETIIMITPVMAGV